MLGFVSNREPAPNSLGEVPPNLRERGQHIGPRSSRPEAPSSLAHLLKIIHIRHATYRFQNCPPKLKH